MLCFFFVVIQLLSLINNINKAIILARRNIYIYMVIINNMKFKIKNVIFFIIKSPSNYFARENLERITEEAVRGETVGQEDLLLLGKH